MRYFIFIFILLTIAVVIPFAASRLLRITNRKIWHLNILNFIAKYYLLSILLFVLIWVAGAYFSIRPMLFAGITGTSLVILTSLILILTLPFSMLLERMVKWYSVFRQPVPAVRADRRKFLKTGAAILPVLALGSTGTGVARSFTGVRIPEIDMRYPDLPDALDGFSILHLSDLHLGYYYHLAELEETLRELESKKIDLVLITGDVADDLDQLPGALKLIDQIKTSYPKFVSLGNHEYHRGIRNVTQILDKGPVMLLKNTGHTITVSNQPLFVGGADDPVIMHSDVREFLSRSAREATVDAPPDSFRILMSHRPRALDVAEKYGIDLVLSGHTHGGQIGLNGRSLFESIADETYLWGKYKLGSSQLYTSSGVGHWFPFRLGCPAEAPVITLRKTNGV